MPCCLLCAPLPRTTYSGGGVPWTAGNNVRRALMTTVLRAAERGERAPDIMLRAHVHQPATFEFGHTRIYITPSFKLRDEYAHKIGASLAPIGGIFITQTVGTGTFTTNSAYDLKDVDQYDWNKFTGIAFTPLEPDRNSAMVGWRYNLTTQEFEIAPFYNVDKVRILPNENPLSPEYEVISVPAGETFEFDVDYSGITLHYDGKMVFKPYPPGLVANVWTAARVSGWFGGNEVAPRTISYFLRLN